jgi:hypothetical protein
MAGRVYDSILRTDGVSIAGVGTSDNKGVPASKLSDGKRGSVASVGKDENCSGGTTLRLFKPSNVLSAVLCKGFVLVGWLTQTADNCGAM